MSSAIFSYQFSAVTEILRHQCAVETKNSALQLHNNYKQRYIMNEKMCDIIQQIKALEEEIQSELNKQGRYGFIKFRVNASNLNVQSGKNTAV